jgi:uncharacterized membrane protein YgaE (UPF0421/DUF939 family)
MVGGGRRSRRETPAWDVALARGRSSMSARLTRLRGKSWHIGQAALAAGVAWFIANDLLDHPTPFFAPIAAVVCLGTSYGQRLRRVVEVTLGVAIGVFVADLVVLTIGSGWWQLAIVVALAMSAALLLDAGNVFVTQAAVQSIVVASLVVEPSQALIRWTDALIGGAVALVAATVVPQAPLRRPGEQAALVLDKIAFLLRGTGAGLRDGEVDDVLDLLSDARSTDVLIEELVQAAREGLSAVASSPFRARHRGTVRLMSEIVEPLDLALRNTRVLVRRAAVAAYRRDPVPRSYALLCEDLADLVERLAEEIKGDMHAEDLQPELVRLAEVTSQVERTDELSAEVVLAQLRSIIADLLRVTGMGSLESTDAIPPLRRTD